MSVKPFDPPEAMRELVRLAVKLSPDAEGAGVLLAMGAGFVLASYDDQHRNDVFAAYTRAMNATARSHANGHERAAHSVAI